MPVVGYVGGGERVENVEDPGGGIDVAEPPISLESANAVVVKGDSMWPAYRAGSVLYFEETDHVNGDALGRICIVQTAADETLVKLVEAGPEPGVYRLRSLVANVRDIETRLRWAAPVKGARFT